LWGRTALASKGLKVTAIDLSPTVIKQAINTTPSDLKVNYLVGDVTNLCSLGIADNTYELAINIGCLHMMTEDEDRIAHLTEVKRILVDGGLFFLQNGLSLDDVKPKSPEEKKILEQLYEFFTKQPKPGELIKTYVSTPQGKKEMMVPLCPSKRLSMKEYIAELEQAGFSVVFAEQGGGANMPFEAIIIAKA
jgi:ubiquinone/menaquinone biosynthesis C-methylase UbiE